MIIESINALTKKLTGQDGTGSDITESINDLTKKWTGSNNRGETIAEALDVLAQHAEGGGGGATFPTFTAINDGDSWSCDMTFNEVVALVGEYGDDYGYVPCKEINFLGEVSWDVGEYTTDFDVSAWTDMPDTVTALFIFNNNSWAFADDGKIYMASNP